MISINYRDPRPIYEQVKASIRRLIVSGVMVNGEKLPSVRELASQLAINPNTIQRAYRELETEGYIYSVAGKGSFVAQQEEVDDGHRLELLKKFDEIANELLFLGIKKEELCDRIKIKEVLKND